MPALELSSFNCVRESGERGDDSPYFVVFHGERSRPDEAQVTVVRREDWDNDVATGDVRRPQIVVAKDVDTSTLVLVALLEEDGDPDVGLVASVPIMTEMRKYFAAFACDEDSNAELANKLAPELRKLLREYTGDDEIVDIDRLPITRRSGDLDPLELKGDGALYRAQFAMLD